MDECGTEKVATTVLKNEEAIHTAESSEKADDSADLKVTSEDREDSVKEEPNTEESPCPHSAVDTVSTSLTDNGVDTGPTSLTHPFLQEQLKDTNSSITKLYRPHLDIESTVNTGNQQCTRMNNNELKSPLIEDKQHDSNNTLNVEDCSPSPPVTRPLSPGKVTDHSTGHHSLLPNSLPTYSSNVLASSPLYGQRPLIGGVLPTTSLSMGANLYSQLLEMHRNIRTGQHHLMYNSYGL